MATKNTTGNELVWFKNKATGWVEAAHKGSEAFKRMSTEMTAGDEPELVWEKTKAPTVHKPVKPGPGVPVYVNGKLRGAEQQAAKAAPSGSGSGDAGSGSGSGDGGKGDGGK